MAPALQNALKELLIREVDGKTVTLPLIATESRWAVPPPMSCATRTTSVFRASTWCWFARTGSGRFRIWAAKTARC